MEIKPEWLNEGMSALIYRQKITAQRCRVPCTVAPHVFSKKELMEEGDIVKNMPKQPKTRQ